MKKQMSIVTDKKQAGVRIPKEFVEEFKITKQDKVEWESRNKKLNGKLVKYADKSKIKKEGVKEFTHVIKNSHTQ